MNLIDWSWDDRVSGYLAGHVGGYLVHVMPMILNHRVVLTPDDDFYCYDAAWCYPDLVAAVAALNRWDPATEDAPPDYVKAVGLGQPWDYIERRLRR